MNEIRPKLIEGRDYYVERGAWVFTREYHLRRGKCCHNGCRHCPYRDPEPTPTSNATPKNDATLNAS